ncbi:MAG: GTPase HflX [Gammaproteobacteria bacterium]|nr:GTPase HflX [Gammaproteobacteria bacterium]HJL96457.1 GTPase HflX [SAR86 cluster bacterium]HJM59830.1 GTPase HflX [SAR86 cluster bacterium]|tara:strand:+ start:4286 stop:5590 length:1305 start_codon:yes stop_codon:yes gene_type:complete
MNSQNKSGPISVIVHVERSTVNPDNLSLNSSDEFRELCMSSGSVVGAEVLCKIDRPTSNFFIKKGKLEEIRDQVIQLSAELVIFNNNLSPSQERNLEKALNTRVLDRTSLILDIFATRATSHIGKLQVELAQLSHLSTRLVRGWSHLERQKGGIGLRGPGETQLETDRRLIGHRIRSIKKRLDKAHNQKEVNRYSRKKGRSKVVALVGYTNAGKTTLFNYLTENFLYAADKPFATLDSVTRKNSVPELKNLLFSDTVGFISDLPTQLVESFKATLDDLQSADLLLHVVDISDKDYRFKKAEVNKLLHELGLSDIPIIRVNNKSDKANLTDLNEISENNNQQVWISALNEEGLDSLFNEINLCLFGLPREKWVSLYPELGWLRARLYSYGSVIDERTSESGLIQLRIKSNENELKELKLIKGFEILNDKLTQEAI